MTKKIIRKMIFILLVIILLSFSIILTFSGVALAAMKTTSIKDLAHLNDPPSAVTITPDPGQSKIYGEADPLFSFSNNGGLSMEDFTGSLGRSAGETVAGGPYNYTLGTLSAGSRYTLTLGGSNTFFIAPRNVTIAADLKTKTYGEADPVLTYHFSSGSLISNDSFTGSLDRVSGENAGTYAITRGTLALSGNYNLTYSEANLIINKATPGFSNLNSPTINYNTASVNLGGNIKSGILVPTGNPRITLTGETHGMITPITIGTTGDFSHVIDTSSLTIGTYPITYYYPGDNNFNEISDSTKTLTVNNINAMIALSNLSQAYDGQPKPVTYVTTPPGLTVSITYDGSSSAPTNVGVYTVDAYITNAGYTGNANATLTIIGPSPTPTPQPSGGGGGGGGGSGAINVLPSGFSTTSALEINSSGIILTAAKLTTKDGKATLDIPYQTKLLSDLGNPLSLITVANAVAPPAPPSNNSLVLAFTFGPDGAKFDPAINLSLNYDPGTLPANTQENSLFIAYWNGSQWISLESQVDTTRHTVVAPISHFSTYSLLGNLIVTTPSPSREPAPVLTPDQEATPSPTATPGILPEATTTIPVSSPVAETASATETSSPLAQAQTPPFSMLIVIWVVIFVVVASVTVLFISRRRTKM